MSVEAVKRGLQLLYERDAVVLDTETTGGSKQDEVIDLAVVSLRTGQVIFQKYFLPQMSINPFAYRVHGISMQDLARYKAEKFIDYAEHVKLIFGSEYPILAYNKSADYRYMKQTFDRYKIDFPEGKWHCAMKAYKQFAPDSKHDLTSACKSFNIAPGLDSILLFLTHLQPANY